ncbi:MAG TPA: homocysteine S-methyltransferase [Dermatophilaceae bacterium]|nr:homocysteine S-methyltransferase [Dermatophilaceae bacterium]
MPAVSRPRDIREAVSAGPIVLDGGFATRLEARGHDLSSALWSARLLLDDPAEIVAAHRDFAAAGAQVAITASYQVSAEGLAAAGLDPASTDDVLALSVACAREAMEPVDGWVAASIGPYGATLADGSEYTGAYAVPAGAAGAGATAGSNLAALQRFLRDWHARRLEALVAAGPDLLAVETIPCLAEVEVLLEMVAASGIPAWLSVTCAGDRLRSGEPAAEAFSMSRGVPGLVGVGVNCTSPADAGVLVPLAYAASGRPVVVYPNSGETWDAQARSWRGAGGFRPAQVRGWLAGGAGLVGGCCRVTPQDIAEIAEIAEVVEVVRDAGAVP